MATHIHTLLGIDKLGRKGLSLLINLLATTTYANYYSNLRTFFTLCLEENIHPLHATSPATMVCFITWLCLYETIATATLQPYFSTVNKFVRDHQHEPIVVGKLLVDARRGLELRHERLTNADAQLPLPTPLALQIPLQQRQRSTTTPRVDNAVPSPALALLSFACCMRQLLVFSCRAE
jgi:hypothetical protein